jgi:hypothetical protein
MAYIVDEQGKVIDRKTNSNLFMPKPPPTVYKPKSTQTASSVAGTTNTALPAQPIAQPVAPTVTPQQTAEDYINDAARIRQETIELGLKSAYDQNVGAINEAKAKLPAAYDTARNAAASQSAVERQNFNEYAAATGLNSGTGGQAQLAFSNVLQGQLGALNTEQANKSADYDRQIVQLTTKYRNDVAQALKEGEYQKAQDLFANYKTQQAQLAEQQRYDTETYNRTAAAASAKKGTTTNMPSYTPPVVLDTAPDTQDTSDKVTNTTPSGRTGFITVPGIGRLSWGELLIMVENGKVIETQDPETGKYTYKKA